MNRVEQLERIAAVLRRELLQSARGYAADVCARNALAEADRIAAEPVTEDPTAKLMAWVLAGTHRAAEVCSDGRTVVSTDFTRGDGSDGGVFAAPAEAAAWIRAQGAET